MEKAAVAMILGLVLFAVAATWALCTHGVLAIAALVLASLYLAVSTGAAAFSCGEEFQKDRDDIGED